MTTKQYITTTGDNKKQQRITTCIMEDGTKLLLHTGLNMKTQVKVNTKGVIIKS
jgi:hypothetical protein